MCDPGPKTCGVGVRRLRVARHQGVRPFTVGPSSWSPAQSRRTAGRAMGSPKGIEHINNVGGVAVAVPWVAERAWSRVVRHGEMGTARWPVRVGGCAIS